MPIRHVVVLDADTLSILIGLADAEADRLHDTVQDTEDDEDLTNHINHVVLAGEAQDAISKALEALSHVRLLEAARDMLIDTEVCDASRIHLVGSIDRFLTGQRPEEPDPV
jgi:hypothetical protein